MKPTEKLSRNEQRRLDYAKMSAENSDEKDRRNTELSEALGTVTKRTETLERDIKWFNEDGKLKKKTVVVASISPMHVSAAAVGFGESRAQKRARLKARRNRLVKDYKHPNGACGNIGCKQCSK